MVVYSSPSFVTKIYLNLSQNRSEGVRAALAIPGGGRHPRRGLGASAHRPCSARGAALRGLFCALSAPPVLPPGGSGRAQKKPAPGWGRWCAPAFFSARCGKGGIRTPGTRESTPDFESGPFDHSGTFPARIYRISGPVRTDVRGPECGPLDEQARKWKQLRMS